MKEADGYGGQREKYEPNEGVRKDRGSRRTRKGDVEIYGSKKETVKEEEERTEGSRR